MLEVTITGTCYKCGKEYKERLPQSCLDARLDHFDPTDWECPVCSREEDEAMAKAAEEMANECLIAQEAQDEELYPIG